MHHRHLAPWFSRALLVGVAVVLVSVAPAQTRPMELADLFRLKRVSEPQIAPDGRHVAYVVTEVLKDENRTNADLWVVNAGLTDGPGLPAGATKRLTHSPKRDAHPRWSPDGKWIAFESTRSGESQIFLLPADGGEARQLTTIATGAAQANWAPDGKSIAFVSAVWPEFSAKPFREADKLNREKQEARDKSKVKARVIDQLLYRHWDEWVDGKRQHLFVVRVTADGAADGGFDGLTAGEPRNVTPGENDAVPTSSTFDAGDEYAFSADGKELVFTAPPLPVREQAWRTNHDVWSVNLATLERKNLTAHSPGADGRPRFSPDGKTFSYRAQARAGFEADKWDLWLEDRATGRRRNVTAAWPESVDNYVWAPDGRTIFLEAQEKGRGPLWSVAVAGPEAGSAVKRIVGIGVNHDLSVSSDGKWMAFIQQEANFPPEVSRHHVGDGGSVKVTNTNEELTKRIRWGNTRSVTVEGAGKTPVQMWITLPPDFDPAKKYPLVFWVHGGPQSAFLDSWSTRWNVELWAAQGYVIARPNPRGSTGFGQKFTDEISHDWGGRVFDDLMACLAHLEQQPYIDATRMAAAGASYGGYMMNWFQGHTDKFKTLVTHCGVYDFVSMYGTTEEVWFDEWDHGIPWENPEFEQWSPHRHAAKFKTPNLIIHNELDFRVPIGQGLSLFTTLQRKNVPSKLLYFPDEGHWVLKPQNSELWHQTVFAWLAEYLKK